MKHRFALSLMLLASFSFFAFQTIHAFATVAFHAELFEKKGTVIIDAGHGGEDGGAVGINGAMEKDINLAIALELEKDLKRNNFNVIMVRDGDYAVGDQALSTVAERKRSDTKKRLEIAQQEGDAILISIHQNHFTESKYYGAQMFYSGNHPESAELAEWIRKSIVEELQPENTRESKQADKNIYLLYHCEIPAVIVECGFISNQAEADLLNTGDYQKSMADAIYRGLIHHLASKKEDPS